MGSSTTTSNARRLTLVAAVIIALVVAAAITITGRNRADAHDASSAARPTAVPAATDSPASVRRARSVSQPRTRPVRPAPVASAKSTKTAHKPKTTKHATHNAQPINPAAKRKSIPNALISQATSKDSIKKAVRQKVKVLNRKASPNRATRISGALMAALKNQQLEFDTNDWTQVGVPTFSDVAVIKVRPKAKPPTAVVQACVDSSSVRVLDADGHELRNAGTPDRSLNIFTLHKIKGTWVLVGESFPNNPRC